MKSFVKLLTEWVIGRRANPSAQQSAEEALLRLGQSTGQMVGKNAEHLERYETLKVELLEGNFNNLLFLSPYSLERMPQDLQHNILLLKLSAQLQSGDMAAARALTRKLLGQECPTHTIARTMTASLVFSQARLHRMAGQEKQAKVQYIEALSLMHCGGTGIDIHALADTWLNKQPKPHAPTEAVHV